jgi:hypothetical protein
MAIGLGLGLAFPLSSTPLDPDAAAYVTAIRGAGATVSSGQAIAISNFIIGEKAAGRWTSLKYLSLPIWNVTAANAIDMISLVSGTFTGGFTNAPGYWWPDGVTGYFNSNRTPTNFGQTASSNSIGAMLLQAGSGTTTRVIVHSLNSLSQYTEMQHSSTLNTLTYSAYSNTPPGSVNATATRAQQIGVLVGSRDGGTRSLYRRINTSFNTLVSTAGADIGTVPTANFIAARSDFSPGGIAYNDAQYCAIFAGTGWSQTYSRDFSLSLETLWENIMGQIFPLDTATVAYVAAIRAAGATVSDAQELAINDFIVETKTTGTWAALNSFFFPVWNVAAANAIDMKTLNSGTFVGSVTHAPGYIQGDGTTGVFNTGFSAASQTITTSSGTVIALSTQAGTLGFRGLFGRSQGGNLVTFFSSNGSQLFRYNTSGSGVTGSSAGTGIYVATYSGGSRTIYRRVTAGHSTLVSTVGGTAGSVPSAGNYGMLGFNGDAGSGFVGSEFNNARMSAAGLATGFTAAQSESFTLSLKNMFETVTGGLLP